MSGLALGLDFGADGFPVRARLAGLGVEFERLPLRVGGALINRQPLPQGFDMMVGGTLVVQLPQVGVTAVGAYRRRSDGMPSLFVFGRGVMALGGPPPFRLQGVAAGFGFDSSVSLPSADRVADFPLVSGLGGGLPGQKNAPSPTVRQVVRTPHTRGICPSGGAVSSPLPLRGEPHGQKSLFFSGQERCGEHMFRVALGSFWGEMAPCLRQHRYSVPVGGSVCPTCPSRHRHRHCRAGRLRPVRTRFSARRSGSRRP
ncbi:DUF6603 domain-containing protein [Streptomyces sp. WAC01526]|uniref:DUF6603 domain-containing protein n=1 Tax=Streptomyces sp. WAC01526 TaxID=2588709 RepID=UPI00292A3DED|nr:DUF6603 domain-containing protein [Streptomyces sp. WAC01526]